MATKNDTLANKHNIIATKGDLAAFDAKISKKIGGLGSDMIKWMFIFWVGQIAVTFGFILLFLKK